MVKRRQPSYCRLLVILATDAPKAVIIRRGPSRWARLTLWETDTDTFTDGQWFKGRIYEDRCDLSPDGLKFIYFASKQERYARPADGYPETWTAISKPPYFTALAMWSNFGTYGGGGYFLDNQTVCHRSNETPHPNHLPHPSLRINPDGCVSNISVRFWRMLQSGWIDVSPPRLRQKYHTRRPDDPPFILQKTRPDGTYTLTMEYEGHLSGRAYGNSEFITYSCRHNPTGTDFVISDTWADWDSQGRLVFVEEGRLLVGDLKDGVMSPRLVYDFNPERPELIRSPEWARTWD